MHKIRSLGLALLVAFGVLQGSPTLAQDSFTLNINTALSTDDPMFIGLQALKAAVEQRTANKLQVRLYPGSQLGPDEAVLEQARAGASVAVLVDGGRLAPFVKEFGILGAPYLADNFDELRKIVTSPMFEAWVARLRDASNHQVLAFNWFQGDRHLLTNQPVRAPADLKGVRMRTPGAPVWLETVRAMGATPTPMPWAEVYSALQLKAIDAAEAQLPAVWGSRLYEVVKHVTKTSHFQLITGLVTSRAWYDKLPADMQKALREEALKAGDDASRATIESLVRYEGQMKEKGVTFAPADAAVFKAATETVYEKLGYSDLRKEVNAIIGRK
jgi:tripartite ATP-independent transporter DctP family solute receptor